LRKTFVTLALALGLVVAMAVPISAATLHDPHQGTACPAGYEGTWHFVNNQTGGASAGTLVVQTDAGFSSELAPDKVNRNVQHWWVEGGTTLINAWSSLDGKLVLSDYSCREVKKST
jgi:hypothetical protein